MENQKMTNENIETAKADTKNVMSDLGNKLAHAKADAEKASRQVHFRKIVDCDGKIGCLYLRIGYSTQAQ